MMVEAICPVGDHIFEYDHRSGPKRTYCSEEHHLQVTPSRQVVQRAALAVRTCSRCKQDKPKEEFAGPTASYCRPCMAAWAREKRALHKYDPAYRRTFTLRGYGLTLETFDAMLAAQDGRCAICRTAEPDGQGWHVDHDHSCCARKRSCGKCRRGILCSRCNIAIGNLRDDPVIIRAALDYVTAHKGRLAA